MKSFFLFFILLFTLVFTACSTKKVYEPENVEDSWRKYGKTKESIVDVTSDVALLKNRKVLSKDGISDVRIQESHRLIGKSDGWILSANIDGELLVQFVADLSLVEKFELKKTIASASVKDDILAVLFTDNEMALYSISTKELLLKEQGNSSIIVDSRIVNPYFMNDLALFLTLDGKVVIINTKLKKKLRTIIVSSEDFFNNIINFNVVDSKLIAATGHKMLSLASKEIRVSYEIRNIAYAEKDIFITTKQGEVISLTPDLQVNAKIKFPFAHFLGIIAHKNKLYLLEKEGYIIEIGKDLLEYKVYEVDISDGYIFTANKKFYINDEYISVE
ncbi:hypothetical protein KKG72_07375 [bacterium]|nr:hypothetical protein [bacterium]MBU1994068.1 hypothetical protein [bacterium]